MSQLNNDDLVSAQENYLNLLETARLKQGHMSAGATSKGSTVVALEELGNTRITFGHPEANLVHLTSGLLKKMGLELDAIQKARLKTDSFYYLTIAVSMIPGDAVVYDQLKCELEFEASDGNRVPIIYKMFPGPEWKAIMQWGGELTLGLGADFNWSINLDLEKPEVMTFFNQLPATIQAKVQNKNNYKGAIKIPSFSYSMGRAEISATGEGNTFGFWDIQKPELKQSQTINFVMVFKAPKSVKKVKLTGKTTAGTSKNWLFSNLKPLLSSLSKSQTETVKKGLPLGDYQEWDLKLPA